MGKKLLIFSLVLLALAGGSYAHDLEPLHVDGRYLKNPQGDIVTLHGWIGDWIQIYDSSDDNESKFNAWKLTTDSILAAGYKLDYARISCGDVNGHSFEDFDSYIMPIVDYLNSKGIYVLLFPDVTHEDDAGGGYLRTIGDPRWQRSLKWLDFISRHPRIKNNPGVMFKLAIEPGNFLGSDGSWNSFKTLKDYYQPMVDVIRKNGSNQVIWVPGQDYQISYGGYASFPIEGDNIGYAIHFYPFTPNDDNFDMLRKRWAIEMEMASNMAPLILTETAWSGGLNGFGGSTSGFGRGLKRLCDDAGNVSWNIYSEGDDMAPVNQPSPNGKPTESNYPEAQYIPWLQWTQEYAETKYTPVSELKAERVELENTFTTVYPGDTRPITLMAAFANGRRWNVAGDATWTSSDESVVTVKRGNMYVKKEGTATVHGVYTDYAGNTFDAEFTVTSSLFPLTADGIINNLFWPDGTYDETTHIFRGFGCGWYYTFCSNIRPGMPAWNYYGGMDFSAYKYLVIRLDDTVFTGDESYNHGSIWINSTAKDGPEAEAVIDMEGKTELVIDLHAYPALDISHIVSIRIDGGDDQGSCIREMFLSNDGVNPVTEPFTMSTSVTANDKVMFYGDDVPELTYCVIGPGTVSEPTLTTTATRTSPVGTYDILISGSQDGVTYKPGKLTIVPAPLTVMASDMVIGKGSDIPKLQLKYDGLRNGETAATALSEKPTVTTTATKDSPCGNYEISVSGGSAANYDIVCYGGTLTITPDLAITLPADRTGRVGTSQEAWQAGGVCSTQYAPAVTTADGRTAPMVERYGDTVETVETVGTVMEQTVTGLEDGDYTLVLCANAYYNDGLGFDTNLTEGATDVVCLHANDVTVPMTAHIGTATTKNDEYTLEVTVIGGTLHISMEKLKAGTNWHTLQIKSLTLTRQLSLNEAYAKAVAEAEELLPQKMSVYTKNTLQQTMAAEHTYANYYWLAEAIAQARKNINSMASAARALEVMRSELLTATNVCTPLEATKYWLYYRDFKKLYDENLLTDWNVSEQLYNPYEGGGGPGYFALTRFLMSAWEYNMENTPNMDGAPYSVSWSNTAPDESGFKNPCIEYWAPEGSPTLAARTLTATMTDMEPGEYTLSAFVRLNAVNGDEAPKGISMQLCDGEAVPLGGERFRDWGCYLGHYTAKGTVGNDGVLTVKFHVTADNNVSQLAFRDLWLDDGSAVTANDLTMTYGDDVPELTYTASGNLADGTPELTTTATSTSPVGTYPITVKPGTVGNSFVRYTNGTLTILPAPLTITADDKTKKQGDAMPELTATYQGFKNDETSEVLTQQPTLSCTATAASAPGTYPITVSGATAQNYDIAFVGGTLTVTEADAVSVTANSYTIEYGDALPEFGYTVEGAELQGNPSIICAARQGSPVGTYDITITKGGVENYNVTYVNGTLTITKAPLTVGVEDAVITEGDAIPTFALTYDGFRCGDTEATAFTTKPTATTEATAASAPGEYPITLSGGEATNYELNYTGGTLTIETSPLPQDEDLTARVGTSQEDWHAWGVCATVDAPAITTSDGRTAQMMETYEETVETTGEMMYQAISGLEPGDYAVELYANAQYTDGCGFASDLRDGATDVAYVSANDRRCYITAHVGMAVSENGVYSVYARVTDGTLRLGLTAEKAGTNWHTLQIKKLTLLRQGTVVYADDKERKQGLSNPTFTYTVSGAELTGEPRLLCTATTTSAPGTYPIWVTKGTLSSDQPIYLQPGVLTVTVTKGIEAIGSSDVEVLPLYDLQGRRVEGRPKPGIYIRKGKVVTIRKQR